MKIPEFVHVETGLDECPVCGLRYKAFRTGHTFASVRELMRVNSTNSDDWVYKRRNGVLGRWHQIKLEMWDEHVYACVLASNTEEEPEESDITWMEDI